MVNINKQILIILLISLLSFNVYAVSLNLTLSTDKYGPNTTFNGYLDLDYIGNFSYNETFTATTKSKDYKIGLKSWLDSSSISYATNPSKYETSGDAFSSSQILTDIGSKIIGFKIPKSTSVANVTLELSGFGDLSLDVGNDGKEDYQNVGTQIGFNSEIYPTGYNSDSRTDLESSILTSGTTPIKKCQNLNVTFNDFYPSQSLRVYVLAKKIASGANLTLSISGKECKIPDSSMNSDSYVKSSCDFTFDNPQSKVYQICVYAKGGSSSTTYYRIPKLNDFYFMTASTGLYNTTIDGSITARSQKINTKVQELLNSCSNTQCIVPIKFTLRSSGVIDVDNGIVQDKMNNEYSALYNIVYTEPTVNLKSKVRLLLSKFTTLATPTNDGDYTLKLRFKSEDSNTVDYTVGEVPKANINASKSLATINQSITFSGSGSTSPYGTIKSYKWDFGDGKNATGLSVSHKYEEFGTYLVTLSVEDSQNVIGTKTLTIYIQTLDTSLSSLIETTLDQVDQAELNYNNYPNNVREVYQSLGYNLLISNAKTNLTNINNKYNSIKDNSSYVNKEDTYAVLLDQIDSLRSNIPLYMQLDVSQSFNIYPDISEIPSPAAVGKSSSNEQDFKDQVALFNSEKVKVNSDVKRIKINFIEGNSSFVLVKKTISSEESNVKIVENFLSGNVDDVEIIYPTNYQVKSEYNLIDFSSTREIMYKSNNMVGVTVGIPSSITSLEESVCGNDICESDETKSSCSEDCGSKTPWHIYIPLIILVILGIIYINFYKGPWNFKELGNKLSIKFRKKRLFTNKDDLKKLSDYVTSILARGYKEPQIRSALIRKGWTAEQIDYAFRQQKKPKI